VPATQMANEPVMLFLPGGNLLLACRCIPGAPPLLSSRLARGQLTLGHCPKHRRHARDCPMNTTASATQSGPAPESGPTD
jgi:hypothetical protein